MIHLNDQSFENIWISLDLKCRIGDVEVFRRKLSLLSTVADKEVINTKQTQNAYGAC